MWKHCSNFFLISWKWPITIKKILPDSNSTKSKTRRTKLVCCLDTIFRNKRSILTGWNCLMKYENPNSFFFSFFLSNNFSIHVPWNELLFIHSFFHSFIGERKTEKQYMRAISQLWPWLSRFNYFENNR